MVRNTEKRAEHKAIEIQELEVQLSKGFYCGSCNFGFYSIEEYKEHCNEDEHNYHITRRIEALVPGLGFCPACSCLIQTGKGWESHAQSLKHSKCIESLNAIGIHGEYGRPLGCGEIGQLGLPIESIEIDQKISAAHGYGHGGKLGKNVPLIGLNHVTQLGVLDKDEMPKYHCGVCDMNFTFEHRSKHLTGMDHRAQYLEQYYERWFEDFNSMDSHMKTRKLFRLMWYAYQVERLESEDETETAKTLRHKFVNEVTQKKESNKRKVAMQSKNPESYRGGPESYRGGPESYRGGPESYRGGPQYTRGGPREGRGIREGNRGGMMGEMRGRPAMRARGSHRVMMRGGPVRCRPPGMMMRGPSSGIRGRPRHNLPMSTLPRSTLLYRGRGTGPRRALLSHSAPFMEEHSEFSGGYCGDLEQSASLGGKRPVNSIHVSSKKYKEDPYAAAGTTNQLDVGTDDHWDKSYDPYEESESKDYSKALEAIEVLENFAMSQAKESIKSKIDSMKNAVLVESGVTLESLRGSQGRVIRSRGSRGLGSFPPRPIMGRQEGPRPSSHMFGSRGPPPRGMGHRMRPPMGAFGPRHTLPVRGMRSRGRGMRPPMRPPMNY